MTTIANEIDQAIEWQRNRTKVEAGKRGSDDYDVGYIQSVDEDGETARIAWNTGTVTDISIYDLRQATPVVWMSVETPSVFHEIMVAQDEDQRTTADLREIDELAELAQDYGTYITTTGYRRG